MTYSVAVSGASGYAGGEILRLLAAHPDIEIRTVTAHSNAGQPLIDHQPHLRSLAHLQLQDTTAEVLRGHDIVFLALPHGQSGQYTDALADTPLVIDAGADHRLTSADAWEQFYGGHFHESWTYGVPELPIAGGKQRDRLVGATRIAAPGCNASTVSLSLAPGVAAGVIEPGDIVTVLAVGPSGAGKSLKPNLLAAEVLGTANPYAVGGSHRHIPEIRQALAEAASKQTDSAGRAAAIGISFTPVIVPMSRGILATSTAPIAAGATDADIRRAWEDAYRDETFVQLLPEGRFPRTADVLGANTALMGLAIDRAANRVVVVTAVDNLVKGTAGAAIQSMNIALGLNEAAGLTVNGVAP
ncbi:MULTISPECIES: N-acetyl-gamma-glutamyl-phosphate reductase [unclassified Microbacterium]|uniref:N-acetyl-gamma-glutamyl-phosphate reductase n=1 Tax=unclassified Microbacterium TaxID=2609290 RepID=UPI00214B6270|nr:MULTISPECIES: N-acetyl-gamma-glutamyl-phosphate reductase [unclassified Microbacterium]MCR2785975.1 N-acetyl-gamma-glutamyl-phosphate reductase [Microbacterium sp. zg.B96]WIM16989.1 N-acetyl-gamma-glutamyl-phosphate reductase [Microbacterium sp. zg-B96]